MKNNYIKIAELHYKYEYMTIDGIDNIDITFDIPDLIKKNLFIQKLDEHLIPYEFKWNDYIESSKSIKDFYIHHYYITIYIKKDNINKYNKEEIFKELEACKEVSKNQIQVETEETTLKNNEKTQKDLSIDETDKDNSINTTLSENIYNQLEYIDNGLNINIILYNNLNEIESINFKKLQEVNYNESKLKEKSFFNFKKEKDKNITTTNKKRTIIVLLSILLLILLIILCLYFFKY